MVSLAWPFEQVFDVAVRPARLLAPVGFDIVVMRTHHWTTLAAC